jgi:hypothetical protein
MKIIVYKTREIEKIISFFQHLPDDWDSYGSPRPSAKTIYSLEKFTSKFFKFFYLRNSVYAIPGGGIQLDFRYEQKVLGFEIFSNGEIRYEQYIGNNLLSCNDPICNKISLKEDLADAQFNALLNWLME